MAPRNLVIWHDSLAGCTSWRGKREKEMKESPMKQVGNRRGISAPATLDIWKVSWCTVLPISGKLLNGHWCRPSDDHFLPIN